MTWQKRQAARTFWPRPCKMHEQHLQASPQRSAPNIVWATILPTKRETESIGPSKSKSKALKISPWSALVRVTTRQPNSHKEAQKSTKVFYKSFVLFVLLCGPSKVEADF